MTSDHPIPRLEVRGISKSFGGVAANSGIDLVVLPGEIHALLGENGAGKSTLVKIIYGLLQADEGEIRWNGQSIRFASPKAARVRGIGMVFQHFSLFEGLSVLENISLGLDRPERSDQLAERISTISRSYGLPLDPKQSVATLSVGERQRVEIVRCLLHDPKLLIMDEPTSVLTPQEVERLFEALRVLAAGGCSILYISHKLKEIQALCSQATILRGGRVVGSCDPRREDAASLGRLMIGGSPGILSPEILQTGAATTTRPIQGDAVPRLVVESLDLPATGTHGVALQDIGFDIRSGEILGIAGVAGNGQTELFQALSGERKAARDTTILVDGMPCGRMNPTARRQRGLASVPEERNGHAAVPDFTLAENTLLTGYAGFGLVQTGMIRWRRTKARAAKIIGDLEVRTTGGEALAASLSGGNLQKFVVGRELMQNPAVLIVAQPTWGVDVHAAATIHKALLALAEAGSAILVISQDLDELRVLCRRLSVINLGRLSPPAPTDDLSIETLGLLMGGVHGVDPAPAVDFAHAL